MSFYQWVENLRRTPAAHGIPHDKIRDVSKLLDRFFPPPAEGDRLYPVRISSELGIPDSLRKIVPIEVHLGPGKPPILRADASNAPGYIFSLSVPPSPGPPSFGDYLLPLATCYAWAAYLAFLWSRESGTRSLTNMPSELGLVYLPGDAPAALTFCLGATWSGADPGDATGAGQRDNDEDEIDRWRGHNIIDPLFSASSLGLDRTWGPHIKRIAARRLKEYILGKRNNNPKQTPFLQPLFDTVFSNVPNLPDGIVCPSEYIKAISIIIMGELAQPLATIVDPDFLISHSKLGPVLMGYLAAVLDARRVSPENPMLIGALQKLLQFYLTPNIFNPVSGLELIPGPQAKPIVEAVVNSYLILIPATMTKLTSLFYHLNNIHEDHTPGAQNYFLFTLSIKFSLIPWSLVQWLIPRICGQEGSAPPIKKLSGIRGIKLYPRALGQAIMSSSFSGIKSAGDLDNATFRQIENQNVQSPVVGPPDKEGAILVQLP